MPALIPYGTQPPPVLQMFYNPAGSPPPASSISPATYTSGLTTTLTQQNVTFRFNAGGPAQTGNLVLTFASNAPAAFPTGSFVSGVYTGANISLTLDINKYGRAEFSTVNGDFIIDQNFPDSVFFSVQTQMSYPKTGYMANFRCRIDVDPTDRSVVASWPLEFTDGLFNLTSLIPVADNTMREVPSLAPTFSHHVWNARPDMMELQLWFDVVATYLSGETRSGPLYIGILLGYNSPIYPPAVEDTTQNALWGLVYWNLERYPGQSGMGTTYQQPVRFADGRYHFHVDFVYGGDFTQTGVVAGSFVATSDSSPPSDIRIDIMALELERPIPYVDINVGDVPVLGMNGSQTPAPPGYPDVNSAEVRFAMPIYGLVDTAGIPQGETRTVTAHITVPSLNEQGSGYLPWITSSGHRVGWGEATARFDLLDQYGSVIGRWVEIITSTISVDMVSGPMRINGMLMSENEPGNTIDFEIILTWSNETTLEGATVYIRNVHALAF